jgi:hypothetical protein
VTMEGNQAAVAYHAKGQADRGPAVQDLVDGHSQNAIFTIVSHHGEWSRRPLARVRCG